MTIRGQAIAGTLESNDVLVTVSPAKGLQVEVDSIVLSQFGPQLEAAARDTARELGVQDAHIHLNDRGAVECTVKARVETALLRAKEAQA